MAAKIEVHPLPPFDPVSDPTSIGQRWKIWKRRFETYVVAVDIKEDKQKRALLLYQAGQETQEIFDTLTATGDDYTTAITKLDEYTIRLHRLQNWNVDYEIFQFRQATQRPEETVDQFVTRLRKLAVHCEFGNLEKELRSAVIQQCKSKRLRRYALREDELTLDKLLSKARVLEASENQAEGMEQAGVSTDTLRHLRKKQLKPREQSQPHKSTKVCRQCGFTWPHTTSPCPAKGKTCKKCGKPNHFAKMCLSKSHAPELPHAKATTPHKKKPQSNVRHIQAEVKQTEQIENSDTESTSTEEGVFTLGSDADKMKVPVTNVEVNDVTVKMMIDTGASTDIIDEPTYQLIKQATPLTVEPDSCQIFAYGSKSQLEALGKCTVKVKAKSKQKVTTFHILSGAHGSLLSYITARDLGLVNVDLNHITVSDITTVEKLAAEYPEVFQGIGKLKNYEVKLHIDTSVQPVAQPVRRIPFHLRKKVSDELKKLETQGIIETVEGPTPWISPLVVIPKRNCEVRLCIDMRMANRAIQRERHPTLMVDDLVDALNGATVFSKLDLRSGYHQLVLAQESRYITTFVTHEGLRRYTRLNFGINSASEIFQNAISEQIKGIPGAINISDDIIIYGKNQKAHDQALHTVLRKFTQVGLTLKTEKCELNKQSLTFFGFVFSAKGISPDPEKVKAIHEASLPKTAKEVRSFLGMANYCAKFIPNFSSITKPLRDLTKKDVQFQWQQKHTKALNKIKDLLTGDTIMAYFDKNKSTELTTDASPWGLSAILLQHSPGQDDRRMVAYASRSLTPVEQRYSQTEREALAIVWAAERFHTYLFGGHFTLYTDCKPVEMIFNNKKSQPPARIERWNLRLQEYNFTTIYTKGFENPSDFLSRHPSTEMSSKEETTAEQYVNFLATHATPNAMSLIEIKQATKNDPTLQNLIERINNNDWKLTEFSSQDVDVRELKQFSKIKEELTVNDTSDLILRRNRIVIPKALRKQTLALAHEGHQGIVKTKQLIREKVWFPNIDREVEVLLSSCIACQANGPNTKPDPLTMSSLPPEPWHTVHIDFCGPFPSGEYLLVVIDAYSRFPEVDIVHSTKATSTISKLDRIFATNGVPAIIKSDNGPPFTSDEFHSYVTEIGVKHQKITPLWPQANSEAENFMKPLTKSVRAACTEKKNWKREIYTFLLNYRATPHTTTELPK